MESIISTYIINEHTHALLPAKQINYETIIVKDNETKYVQNTPFNLIKESCRHYWTDYEGNRQAVIHHTKFTQKVPIPISIQKGIYFFQHIHQDISIITGLLCTMY